MEASFSDRLAAAIARRGTPVIVGLDPHLDLLPEPFRAGAAGTRSEQAGAIERFCLEVLDAVAPIVAVVKPQVAFFERLGPPGWEALESVVRAARDHGLIVLLDAKRGDIGSTAQAYADYLLGGGDGDLDADALTVQPYLGGDSLAPFLEHVARGKGLFVLAKTSNPGSGDLQDRELGGAGEGPLYLAVARMVDRLGRRSRGEDGYSSLGLVVGATHPDQARRLRQEVPHLRFLVPGYGAQGAGADDVVACFDASGRGALVSASRSVLFAYRQASGVRWQEACAAAARSMVADVARALGED